MERVRLRTLITRAMAVDPEFHYCGCMYDEEEFFYDDNYDDGFEDE